jgi:hypothetical protein
MSEPPSPKATSPPRLDAQASAAVNTLRIAIRTVLERLSEAGTPTDRARDLEIGLKLRKTLAWKIHRVAHGSNPLSDARCIPGANGIDRFLKAASRHSVCEQALHDVRHAASAYHGLVNVHADDHPALRVMLNGLQQPLIAPGELRASRRNAFRCARDTWGEQIEARVLSVVFTPSREGRADIATVRGFVGLKRLRNDVVLALGRTIEHDTDRPGPRRARVEAIEPEHVAGGVPLLKRFCSSVPDVTADTLPDGNVQYRFVDGLVGNTSAVTAFTGELRRDIGGALRRDEANTMNAVLITVTRPTALAVIDIWAPPHLWGTRPEAAVLCAVLKDPVTTPPHQWRRLPHNDDVERRGLGIEAGFLRDVGDYSAVMSSVFERLSWDAAGYELHRLRVQYPVMATCVGMTIQLPGDG